MNASRPRDAACVRYYRTIRRGTSTDALQIGYGYNCHAPSEALLEHARAVVDRMCTSQRVAQYTCEEDIRERALFAALVNRYLETNSYTANDVTFTNGSTEGISIVSSFAARVGAAAVLPLPSYYAFEQSARRSGLAVAGYYDAAGVIHTPNGPEPRLFEVLIVPNGVTGSLFDEPLLPTPPVLTLIDCVFQGAQHERVSLRSSVLDLVHRRAPHTTMLLFTASKDLSIPAFRAGAIIGCNPSFADHANADRFERMFSLSPLGSRLMLAYLTVLLTQEGERISALKADFMTYGLAQEFPPERLLRRIIRDLAHMTVRFSNNLELALGGGYPLQNDAEWPIVAGYSALPRLLVPWNSDRAFTRWVRRAGIDFGLKLNPNYLFGGDFASWNALYPGRKYVRLNTSVPRNELIRALDVLACACASVRQGQRMTAFASS